MDMAEDVPTSDRDWRRWSLAGFGFVLFVFLFVISTAKPESVFANPVDSTYPLILVLGVTGAGITAAQQEYAPAEIWSLTRWAGVVTAIFGGLSLWGVFLVLRAGGSTTIAVNIVTAVIATGAGIGIVLGEYDRRRRQESTRAELVETAVKNAMDGVAILNADEEYIIVNQAHADLYRYDDPDAMVGETWRMCYESATVDKFEDEVLPTLAEAGVWRGEAEGIRADGTTFPQELSLTTLNDGGMVCVVRDISNRVEREQELKSTTNLLSTLVESIPAGILAEDNDRRMLFTNQAFCDLFDIEASPEELVGSDCEAAANRFKDLFVDSERFIERTNQSVAKQTSIEREEFDLVDGRTLERRAVPVELDSDEMGYLWVYNDVTERTQYERRLNALHETTRKLMTATSPEAIATHTIDAANDILELPLNGIHLYDDVEGGLVPVAWSSETEDVVGKPPTFTPSDGAAWETFESGESRIFDDVTDAEEVYNPNTPIRSELHLPLGEHGVFLVGETTPDAFDQTDVTLAKLLATNVETALDRAADERELRERERELRQQNEQLEEFASVLSHDLRNPLNVAQGRTEFLDVDDQEEHLAAIRRAHDRMETLIEDVLTLARQGQTVGETTVIPIQRTLTRAWSHVDTGTASIDAAIDLEIEADESRLQQLFENLFRNAIEHGGDNVTVRVDTLADGTGFYVADDGPGIPPDEQETIFDHGYSTTTEGTGFGLAIVQQVVRAHGWSITVTESTDGGARFEIRGMTPIGDGHD